MSLLCLGIETSCDETGVALMENGRLVQSKLRSQEDLHSLYGGVVPEIASREHLRMLPKLVDALFQESGREIGEVDVVAVARGPGLMGSLLVGLGFAKGTVLSTGARLLGVNHLLAHLLAAELEGQIPYPALGLLVSGGHTQLYLLKSPLEAEMLGRSLDDAAGEAFDKTAKMLNLPYPGGVYIDELSGFGTADPDLFPVPFVDNAHLDFSFSGLKTAVANHLAAHPDLRLEQFQQRPEAKQIAVKHPGLPKVCASFSRSVVRALSIKTKRALARHPEAASLLVAGGVAANSMLRSAMSQLAQEQQLPLIIPSPGLCTDNGAMIAAAGLRLAEAGYCHHLDLEAVPRGRPIPWDYSACS